MSSRARNAEAPKVWDGVVRCVHWGLVAGFLVAYLSEDDALDLHVWAGYGVGVLLAVRVLWGFVGTRHARFAELIHSRQAVLADLRELAEFRPKRHTGHGPAGALMVFMLLGALAACVVSGAWVHSVSRGEGVLARLVDPAHPAVAAPGVAEDGKLAAVDALHWDELHEGLANLCAVFVVLHILAIALISWLQRENLAKSMLTGRKRPRQGLPGDV